MAKASLYLNDKYNFNVKGCNGGFSSILIDKGNNVVLKLDNGSVDSLKKESEIYDHLWLSKSDFLSIPRKVWNGSIDLLSHYGIILEMCGASLDTIFDARGGKWSYQTIHYIASKVLVLLREIHQRDLVHGDIKPDNFSIYPETLELYIFDFGLARFFMDTTITPPSKHHILYHENQEEIVGTLRYASLFNHGKCCYSRRDDLESFMYMMIYFYFCQLPWLNEEDAGKIGNMKELYTKAMLEKMGPIWSRLYAEIRDLRFEETIDYNKWISVFQAESVRYHHADPQSSPSQLWRQDLTMRSSEPPSTNEKMIFPTRKKTQHKR
jgi:serine/threonine protein kinase